MAIGSFGISQSGLEVQSSRLAASAANVANLRSKGANGNGDGFTPTRVVGISAADGGVQARRQAVDPASVQEFDPDAPDADENGLVSRANVSLEEEAVTQIEARLAFEANLKALKAQDEQIGSLLDITS